MFYRLLAVLTSPITRNTGFKSLRWCQLFPFRNATAPGWEKEPTDFTTQLMLEARGPVHKEQWEPVVSKYLNLNIHSWHIKNNFFFFSPRIVRNQRHSLKPSRTVTNCTPYTGKYWHVQWKNSCYSRQAVVCSQSLQPVLVLLPAHSMATHKVSGRLHSYCWCLKREHFILHNKSTYGLLNEIQ